MPAPFISKKTLIPLLFRKKLLCPFISKKTPMCPFYFEKNLLYPFYFEKKLLCAFPFYFEKKLLCACSFYFKKTSYTPFISKKNSYVPAPFLTALDSYLLSGSSILELLFPKHTASVLSYSVKVRDRSKLTGYIGRVLGKFA